MEQTGPTPTWKKLGRDIVLHPVNARQFRSGFGPMEENVWSRWDARHVFIEGCAIHTCLKPHVTQWEAPTPLYTKYTQS